MPSTSDQRLGLIALSAVLMLLPAVCSAGALPMPGHAASSMDTTAPCAHSTADDLRWSAATITMSDHCGHHDCCGLAAKAGSRQDDLSAALQAEALTLVAESLTTPPDPWVTPNAAGPPGTEAPATTVAPLRL